MHSFFRVALAVKKAAIPMPSSGQYIHVKILWPFPLFTCHFLYLSDARADENEFFPGGVESYLRKKQGRNWIFSKWHF